MTPTSRTTAFFVVLTVVRALLAVQVTDKNGIMLVNKIIVKSVIVTLPR
ncbi:MAG: hypothetical protein ACFFD4_21680 [Candidatus Odinarchaeota archaeon]